MLIVGLGNPGEKYAKTRHNAGWLLIERYAAECGLKFSLESKHKALVARGNHQGKTITLVIPLSYMNLSGQAVISLLNYYRYSAQDVLIVYDDKDFDSGIIKLKNNGSAGGHNGIKSIIAHLGTENFLRLRIGVGPKPKEINLADFVLSDFSKNELENILPEVFSRGIKIIDTIISEGAEKAMQVFNQK